MKKSFTKLFILLLVGILCITGCQSQKLKFGKELAKVGGMVDIFTELTAKTGDVGIMDSVMAGYYISKDETYSKELMIIEDLVLADEEYGIAARKEGAYTAKVISNAIIELSKEGKVVEIANKYGLEQSLAIDESKVYDLQDETGKADYDAIIAKGELVIGYTVFAPIAYEEDGQLIGFDIELAEAVCAKLGVTAKFQKIDWDTKVFELNSKNIDVIWNGMTITEELQKNTSITIPYLKNKQIAVIRKADSEKYKTTADMNEAIIVVEKGSAGQLAVEAGE